MKHTEDCECCNGTGLCTDIEGTESACMNCNGSGKHKWDDEDYDSSPYCQYCGAMIKAACSCGPIPEND